MNCAPFFEDVTVRRIIPVLLTSPGLDELFAAVCVSSLRIFKEYLNDKNTCENTLNCSIQSRFTEQETVELIQSKRKRHPPAEQQGALAPQGQRTVRRIRTGPARSDAPVAQRVALALQFTKDHTREEEPRQK